jgi:hypothetical protein
VKIKLYHDVCGREILIQQVLDSQGHCPWDGKAFNKDYTAVLAEALEMAEIAGGVLENALEKIAGMNPALTIDENTILQPLKTQFDRLNAHSRSSAGFNQARQGRR